MFGYSWVAILPAVKKTVVVCQTIKTRHFIQVQSTGFVDHALCKGFVSGALTVKQKKICMDAGNVKNGNQSNGNKKNIYTDNSEKRQKLLAKCLS